MPGYPCCCAPPALDCTLFTDDFNRANVSPLDGSWANKNGTIAIVGNQARSSSQLAYSQVSVQTQQTALWELGASPISQEVDVSSSTEGDEVGLGWVDWALPGSGVTNALVKFSAGTGFVTIYQYAGGIQVPLSIAPVTALPGSSHRLGVYTTFDGQYILVTFDGVAVVASSFLGSFSIGALITGIANTGTVTWDNYQITNQSWPFGPITPPPLDNSLCQGVCTCCAATDDAFSQWELIVGGATAIAGSYYPLRGTLITNPGAFSGVNNPQAYDNCGWNVLPAAAPVLPSSSTPTVPGTVTLTHQPGYLSGVAGTEVGCEWIVTFSWPSGGLTNGGGVINIVYAANGVGGCSGVVWTLTLQNAVATAANAGFTPPTTITVEGM